MGKIKKIGFSLIELLVVLAVSVMIFYFVPKNFARNLATPNNITAKTFAKLSSMLILKKINKIIGVNADGLITGDMNDCSDFLAIPGVKSGCSTIQVSSEAGNGTVYEHKWQKKCVSTSSNKFIQKMEAVDPGGVAQIGSFCGAPCGSGSFSKLAYYVDGVLKGVFPNADNDPKTRPFSMSFCASQVENGIQVHFDSGYRKADGTVGIYRQSQMYFQKAPTADFFDITRMLNQ